MKRDKEGGKFELRFYSGYKGEETPRAVAIGNKEFKIDKVLSRKRIYEQKSRKMYEVFLCKMEGKTVEIRCSKSGEWEISFPKNEF